MRYTITLYQIHEELQTNLINTKLICTIIKFEYTDAYVLKNKKKT